MKAPDFKDFTSGFKTRSFQIGGYSVATTAIVLAIVIVLNIFVSAIPARFTQIDTTSQKIYDISNQSVELVSALKQDVTVYWIAQAGMEESVMELFLDRYQSISDKVTVTKIDPDVYPTFASQYTTGSVLNNSLVVTCGDRSRYISFDEIFIYTYASDYEYTGNYDVTFAGESLLTGAVSYLTNDDLPKLYILTGHGETSLSTDYSTALSYQNIEYSTLSLIVENAVPEDADCVFINNPPADISKEEKDLLLAYAQKGGNLLIVIDPAEDATGRPNLEALMLEYGVQTHQGITIDPTQSYYAFGTPYYLLPNIETHAITDPHIESGYYILLPIAGAFTQAEGATYPLTIEELLTTSEGSFIKKAGYNLTTYEKEEGDTDGPFSLAMAVTNNIGDGVASKAVFVASAALVDDATNQQVSGGNQDFFLNAIGWMCGYEDSISIHSKTFSTEYLTMDSSTSNTLTILMIGVIPLSCLAVGIYIMIRRKRR